MKPKKSKPNATTLRAISVDLGANRYPIYISENILSTPNLLTEHIASEQVFIVSAPPIAKHYLDLVVSACQGKQVDTYLLPDGEQAKSIEHLQHIFTALIEKQHRRNTTLVALGGGVVGDITGFAAACYQRGVAFIQIPTTLLAQTDSSVGGKTAVNHPLGKNMIGAFHQPRAVLIDINTLATLPEREFHAGLAEVIKYGAIYDSEFFAWLEDNMDALQARDAQALIHAIAVSCQTKANIVATDERETGVRALLNLGHTFGHAIEALQGYKDWLHGEAVAAGMVAAAQLSASLGMINDDLVKRLKALLKAAKLPTRIPDDLAPSDIVKAMHRDKKNVDAHLRLILLEALGKAVIVDGIKDEQVVSILTQNR